jgi:hypothetical protein
MTNQTPKINLYGGKPIPETRGRFASGGAASHVGNCSSGRRDVLIRYE